MRVITLNVFGGRFEEELIAFLKKYRETTDIFCFQEVFNAATWVTNNFEKYHRLPNPNLYKVLQEALPEHISYFRPTIRDSYGLASFVRKDIKVLSENAVFVYRDENFIPSPDTAWDHARNVQSLVLSTSENVTIFNFHGIAEYNQKDDTASRILQSERLKKYISDFPGKKIVCGDFNVLPHTKSMELLEAFPLRNLVTEYGITSTRSALYTKETKYADYMLVSEEVDVRAFTVLRETVSDHAPLLLDFI